MTRIIFAGCLLCLTLGCRNSATQASPSIQGTSRTITVNPVNSSEWSPIVKGKAYQLIMENGLLEYCDDGGAKQVSLSTGQQGAGTQHCDKSAADSSKNMQKARCNDNVQIWGAPDSGNDHVDLPRNTFLLNGHVNFCQQDGTVFLITTDETVNVIDDQAGKIATVHSELSAAVIGSGWVAWTDDKASGVHLKNITGVMKNAVASE